MNFPMGERHHAYGHQRICYITTNTDVGVPMDSYLVVIVVESHMCTRENKG
jgi:hypothetical protein